MVLNERHAASADPSEVRRRRLRYVTAALCLGVGVLYLVLLFIVRVAVLPRPHTIATPAASAG